MGSQTKSKCTVLIILVRSALSVKVVNSQSLYYGEHRPLKKNANTQYNFPDNYIFIVNNQTLSITQVTY
jgi:hypothetical protein